MNLLEQAKKARENAYAPYSSFQVGAALLAKSGRIYLGANVESSAYSPTLCAERAAFAAAVSAGEREFSAIAIVGTKRGEEPNEDCPPCGVCRQFMREFCADDFTIQLAKHTYTLAELLPVSFGKENLG